MKALLLATMIAAAAAAHAQPVSREPGGIGPIRLGMSEAELKRALPSITQDVVFVPALKPGDFDMASLSKLPVMVPWEDSYIGVLSADTRIQVGVNRGKVVQVMLRRRLTTDEAGCRDAFNSDEKSLSATFGSLTITEPDGLLRMTGGRISFRDWKLSLNALASRSGWCAVMTDFVSEEEAGVEARWRAQAR